jgi:hypothetical protein
MSVMRPADVKDRPIWRNRSVAPPLWAYAGRPVRAINAIGGKRAHKRSHIAVGIDDNGRLLATKTVGTMSFAVTKSRVPR